MKAFILYLKGFIMGIANIIPGVSGGTLAIILGIYENFISSISHLFKNFKENIKFLIPVGLGIGSSILILSGVIEYSYNNFPFSTMMFFVGLVLGGIPLLVKKVRGKKELKDFSSYLIFLITFSIVIVMACAEFLFDIDLVVSFDNMTIFSYIILFIVGVVAAATMVIPGVSGSLVLMLLGYYYPILSAISSFFKFENLMNNTLILGIFGVGVLVGIVLISKLLEMLFKKHKTKTYFGVLGFVFASIIAIPISTFIEVDSFVVTPTSAIFGIVLLILGSTVSYKLGEK